MTRILCSYFDHTQVCSTDHRFTLRELRTAKLLNLTLFIGDSNNYQSFQQPIALQNVLQMTLIPMETQEA